MLKKLRLLSLALIGALLPLIAPVATANATTIYASSYFRSFDADYYLEKDDEGKSVLRVVEEITAVFRMTARNTASPVSFRLLAKKI